MLINLTNVNVSDNFGSTPLHFAAMRGNITALKAILQYPALDMEVSTSF